MSESKRRYVTIWIPDMEKRTGWRGVDVERGDVEEKRQVGFRLDRETKRADQPNHEAER